MLLARFFSVTISKVMIINKQANCSPSSYKKKKKKKNLLLLHTERPNLEKRKECLQT